MQQEESLGHLSKNRIAGLRKQRIGVVVLTAISIITGYSNYCVNYFLSKKWHFCY